MYTEVSLSVVFKKETPQQVIEILNWMCGKGEYNSEFPDHPIFKLDRTKFMLRRSSYYFPQTIQPMFEFDEGWRLTARSNIKNYQNEIELFLNWIKPYIKSGSGSGDLCAVVIYEEQFEPTLYYLDENWSTNDSL